MNFEPTIGLEIHVQLKTKSKMFCACDNNAEGKEPNTTTCPVCMAMPGTLPVPNKKAIIDAMKLGKVLGCEIVSTFYFERKQYFYPDLPKAYQITSQTSPPLMGGSVDFIVNDEKISRRLHHIHLEEDAGKLTHKGNVSLVDLNRAGTPLMEIVTEPEFTSPQEAKAFMQELRLTLRYLGISDADMEKGHMRCDGNISMKPIGSSELGKKAEVKNLNSFSALEKALTYEIKRQTEILQSGGTVEQETRGWDDVKSITVSQRSKEQAHDYRYFPEPDIPPLSPQKILDKESVFVFPPMPWEKRELYAQKYNIPNKDIETLISDVAYTHFFEKSLEKYPQYAKKISNVFLSELLGYINTQQKDFSHIQTTPEQFADVIMRLETGVISGKIIKDILPKMFESGKDCDTVLKEEGIEMVSDTSAIETIIHDVIAQNPKPVEDYKNGKQEAFGFLVGQTMKLSRGQANPKIVNELMKKILG